MFRCLSLIITLLLLPSGAWAEQLANLSIKTETGFCAFSSEDKDRLLAELIAAYPVQSSVAKLAREMSRIEGIKTYPKYKLRPPPKNVQPDKKYKLNGQEIYGRDYLKLVKKWKADKGDRLTIFTQHCEIAHQNQNNWNIGIIEGPFGRVNGIYLIIAFTGDNFLQRQVPFRTENFRTRDDLAKAIMSIVAQQKLPIEELLAFLRTNGIKLRNESKRDGGRKAYVFKRQREIRTFADFVQTRFGVNPWSIVIVEVGENGKITKVY